MSVTIVFENEVTDRLAAKASSSAQIDRYTPNYDCTPCAYACAFVLPQFGASPQVLRMAAPDTRSPALFQATFGVLWKPGRVPGALPPVNYTAYSA